MQAEQPRGNGKTRDGGVTGICGETILDGSRPWFSVQGPRSQMRADMERRIGSLESRILELATEIKRLRALLPEG